MLRRLRLRYEQMLSQSLQGAVQVELGLASRPAAVQNAASLSLHLPHQPEQPLPPHTSIREAYELAQQELLILGEPGTGKSTLLLELAHHLVEKAEQDAEQPLPVLLPLSSWATAHPPLQEWLSEQVALLYDVPRSLSQQWIKAGQLLPLLDGLDEMEAFKRADCIVAINTYHRDHLQPLVVCSRTNEYETAATRERLVLHTAVVVQPLSAKQVDTHLANIGKPLAALRTSLQKNEVLRELATTPLMLQILILTYHGTLVRELSQKEARLREQIWDDYVQRMVKRKGDAERYPVNQTIAWLSWLARQMRAHNQTIFYLEQLQADWLPKRQRTFYRWSILLLMGLVGGLVGGLSFGLVFGLTATTSHYMLRFWLWRTHYFPWKAVSFLEDATARILLRRVGGSYSFIHRLLLDHFADLNTESTPASAAPSSVPSHPPSSTTPSA
jgi:DNA polymerase III delta prime subunit